MGDPPHRQNNRGQQIPADQGGWNGPPLEVSDPAIPGDSQVEGQDTRGSRSGQEVSLPTPRTGSQRGLAQWLFLLRS